jgi:hypothetical protein
MERPQKPKGHRIDDHGSRSSPAPWREKTRQGLVAVEIVGGVSQNSGGERRAKGGASLRLQTQGSAHRFLIDHIADLRSREID